MHSIKLKSPAKLNLFLYVLNRRSDGFHNLYTLFHRISLCDELIIRRCNSESSGFKLVTNHPALKNPKQNIIYRAYQLLKERVDFKAKVEVYLKKKIPLQAGLGGGSSNAAFFLIGMNQLFKLGLSARVLSQVGAELGSDVPFFIQEVNQALGTRRGEKLKNLPFKKRLWFILAIPRFGIVTKSAYEALSRLRKTKNDRKLTSMKTAGTISPAFSKAVKKPGESGFFWNDLFFASCLIEPKLRKIKTFFEELNVAPAMSGSGSTIFTVHSSRQEARQLARRIKTRKPDFKVIICHTY